MARRMLATVAVLLTSVLVVLGLAPTAAAAPAKRPPIPVAGVAGLPSPGLDQDTTRTVIATGASRKAAVSVTWGDGASSRGTSRCSAVRAVKKPTSCVVTLDHAYRSAGEFPIVVRSGKRVIARTSVVVREAAQPWSPPAGWEQPAGWRYLGGGATYVPCSTVLWHYDRSREPTGAAGMRAEIESGLAVLARETGLAFAETADRSAASLFYDWSDLSGEYADAAGVGGRFRGNGFVSFSLAHWWPTDQWAGYGIVTQPDGSYAVGRGWLVVHESMHALGMAHVDDPAAIMNPTAGATGFSGGDLDGLRTMYLNNPCPV